MKQPLLITLLVLLAAGATAGIAWRTRPIEVRIASATIGEATELVYATGFVEPEQPVSLSARLTAPVVAVNADEGDKVRRGQPLIVLDAGEQRGLLAQAQAERRGAELAERRFTTLYGQGWVTRAARDQAVETASAARAGELAAAARLGNNVIRAPFDGVVLKREVEPGNLAVPGVVLMQLGDPGQARINATVDERDIVAVRPGQEVLLSSDSLPGKVLRGIVRTITPGGDPTQRAFRVRLTLVETASLPFGLTLEANIVTRRIPIALLIPVAALNGSTVWTVVDNRVRKRSVRVGLKGADRVQIVSGLRSGEAVVVDPPKDLAEGDRVKIAS